MPPDLDPEDHSAPTRRIERDLIDGDDEELELELEDRTLAPRVCRLVAQPARVRSADDIRQPVGASLMVPEPC